LKVHNRIFDETSGGNGRGSDRPFVEPVATASVTIALQQGPTNDLEFNRHNLHNKAH